MACKKIKPTNVLLDVICLYSSKNGDKTPFEEEKRRDVLVLRPSKKR